MTEPSENPLVPDRLSVGLAARGVLTGTNPDGVNDDAEKALSLIDDLQAEVDCLRLFTPDERARAEIERLRGEGTALSVEAGWLRAQIAAAHAELNDGGRAWAILNHALELDVDSSRATEPIKSTSDRTGMVSGRLYDKAADQAVDATIEAHDLRREVERLREAALRVGMYCCGFSRATATEMLNRELERDAAALDEQDAGIDYEGPLCCCDVAPEECPDHGAANSQEDKT